MTILCLFLSLLFNDFLLLSDGGYEVSSLDETAVLGVVLTDGGDFLFFSEDLDGFSGKGTNRLLNIDLFTH
jgi:hypothetical protein